MLIFLSAYTINEEEDNELNVEKVEDLEDANEGIVLLSSFFTVLCDPSYESTGNWRKILTKQHYERCI